MVSKTVLASLLTEYTNNKQNQSPIECHIIIEIRQNSPGMRDRVQSMIKFTRMNPLLRGDGITNSKKSIEAKAYLFFIFILNIKRKYFRIIYSSVKGRAVNALSLATKPQFTVHFYLSYI